MKLTFPHSEKPPSIAESDWRDWTWQLRHSWKKPADFLTGLSLLESERKALEASEGIFNLRATPYAVSLLTGDPADPLRQIMIPQDKELSPGRQAMLDPLGERKNSPAARVIHRYPDRALFLITDFCSVYCRYCTRKHFTGGERAFAKEDEYQEALKYFREHVGIREIILSGGDPLTLGDGHLDRVLSDLRAIDHIEIIRIGTRMPVVCPMRVTPELTAILKKHKPVYLMTHFNHPREITADAAAALESFVDNGIPVFNQMVLLNGVNNHPAIVQALSRRLLYLRVKPYYMFQCDPSEGTDHLRTSVAESMRIQRELWGTLSGLAMPNLSLDIPDGGGKAGLVPDFEVARAEGVRKYQGWDGVSAEYRDPDPAQARLPADWRAYAEEWEITRQAKTFVIPRN